MTTVFFNIVKPPRFSLKIPSLTVICLLIIGNFLINFSGNINAQVSNFTEKETLGYGNPNAIDVSKDGTKVALATGIGLQILETRTLKPLYMLVDSPFSSATNVAWLSDNNRLVAGYQDGTIRVWDTDQNSVLERIDTGVEGNIVVATPAEGTKFAVGSFHKLQIWDAANQQIVSDIEYDDGWVEQIVWSSDAQQIAVGTKTSSRVEIWDVATGKRVSTLNNEALGAINSLVWSHHGRKLAIGNLDSSPIWIWNIDTNQITKIELDETNVIESLDWSKDDTYLASGDNTSTIKIWNSENGKEISVLKGHTEEIIRIIWFLNNRLISVSKDGSLRLWDTSRGKELSHINQYWGQAFSVSWSPDSSKLAVGYANDGLIWDIKQNKVLSVVEAASDNIWDIKWSPDGASLATGSSILQLWDMRNERPQSKNKLDGESEVYDTSWSPDGAYLAFGGQDNRLHIMQVADWHEIFTLDQYKGNLVSVMWSPDGKRLASGSLDNIIRIWDPSTGKLVSSFLDSDQWPPLSVVWSPDSKFLASTKQDRILIRNAEEGQILYDLKTDQARVLTLAWSPDKAFLASGGQDGTIQIWDAKLWNKLTTLKGHTDRITDLNWAPTQALLASASDDGTVKIWNIFRP